MVIRLQKIITLKISNKMYENLELLTKGKDRSEFIRITLNERIRFELENLKKDAQKENVELNAVLLEEEQ